ncbi:sulfite exporter TauE/SafE family protein [Melaminivora sp.]
MFLALASTVFFMGLMGGTHCLAMCAAPCSAVVGAGQRDPAAAGLPTAEQVVQWHPPLFGRNRFAASAFLRSVVFHLGRLLGYGMAGALAAFAMDGLAWVSEHSRAARPVWTLAHVLVIGWGLVMLAQARQPAWLEATSRQVWARVRPLAARPGGVFAVGLAWALLPCGLLYTALMTAGLSGSPLAGALCMVLFGLGSGVWLVLGPWAWQRLRAGLPIHFQDWGARTAGLVLCILGGWALWMDVVHGQPAPWCVS